jgi:hypothetical protein
VPLFATVPDQKLPRPKFDVEPYPLSRLNNYYRIVPVKNFSSLTVTWALPPITEQVHSKPFRYVSHLLGHESEGSLLSLLKNKGWADQLMAGESRSHSDFACFDVTIELTDEADAHVDEIIGLIFAYIRLIAAEPEPQRWVFDEMRDLASVSFRFRDVVEPSSLVMALAASLPVGVHFASTVPAEAWRAAGAAPFSVSTHTVDEARAARAAGAAWVLLSPIWRSPSKPGDTRPPLGVGVLGAVDGAVALGGVDAARVGACRAAGAAGVAGMGGLFGAPNVGAAVSAWRAAWRGRDQKV